PVGHGGRTVKWLDGPAARRRGGGPRPPGPPKYGRPRARHETRVWLGTLAGAAVATVLLQLAIWYVGDPGRVTSLEAWRFTAWRVAGIHGLGALAYWVWPEKAPADRAGAGAAAADRGGRGRRRPGTAAAGSARVPGGRAGSEPV